MSARNFTVNSEASKTAFFENVEAWYDEHKYLTFSMPRFGQDRSLTQNALFHVWCAEIVAHLMNVNPKTVARNELDGVKRTIKKTFYQAHPETHSWMIYEIRCPITGAKKKDFTSSASWKTGEMFMVLEWMQFWAIEPKNHKREPLILESKGEFAKKQRETNQ